MNKGIFIRSAIGVLVTVQMSYGFNPVYAGPKNRDLVIKFHSGQQNVRTEIHIGKLGDVFITNDSAAMNMSSQCPDGGKQGISGKIGTHINYVAKCNDTTGSTSSSYATLQGDNFRLEDKFEFHTSEKNKIVLTTLYDVAIENNSCRGYVLKHVRGDDLSIIASSGIGTGDKKIPIEDCSVTRS